MKLLPVLFEDHTFARFRPLSWSWPLYELRCGVLNLRERLQWLQREAGEPTGSEVTVWGLLPRSFLQPLHRPRGAAVGPVEVAEAARQADRLFILNGRLGPRWDVLAGLWRDLLEPGNFLWRDADGPLALSLDRPQAEQWLAAWKDGDSAACRRGCWHDAAAEVPVWPAAPDTDGWHENPLPVQGHRWLTAPDRRAAPAALAAVLASPASAAPAAFTAIWDLVPAVGPALTADVQATVATGSPLSRDLFGIQLGADRDSSFAVWRGESGFTPASEGSRTRRSPAIGSSVASQPPLSPHVHLVRPEEIWLAAGVRLAPTAVLDASDGPIVLDRKVEVGPHSQLVGPLYVGPGSLIKGGSRIGGETSIGAVCKIAGEVAETTLLDFSNKQHDGFIGHALIGSWVNLGAGTTCSDLKNNYGPVRVDLGFGPLETGRHFLGMLVGDHCKTAIGTMMNTGSCVGFSSNVFAVGFPPKYLPNFSWGEGEGPAFDCDRAMVTAAAVMARRGCAFTEAHAQLFRTLAGMQT